MSTDRYNSHISINRGFTLIELLVVLAVLWVILGFALPSFNEMILKARSNAIQNTIYSAYQSARTLAVSGGTNITICGSDDGENCTRRWSQSIIIFYDENDNRSAEVEEIKQFIPINADQQLHSRMALGRTYTRFTPTGTASFAGSILICPESDSANFNRRVTWSNVGRIHTGRDLDNDGIVEDINGDPLECLN